MANKNVKTTGTGGKSRYCHREEAKTGARKRRRREDKVWTGLCPAGKHGLDYDGQDCDLCQEDNNG